MKFPNSMNPRILENSKYFALIPCQVLNLGKMISQILLISCQSLYTTQLCLVSSVTNLT